ncbi:MAG: PAS domain S-box protein [Methanobacteriota archaeon]|nr:MAG: PAS domain S-box protein [Euryarchaeota archaeon]
MWVFDLETLRFLDVNDAAAEKYGYSRSEFLAMTLEDIGPREDVPRLREALRTLTPNDRMIGIWRHKKKDGTLFDVEVLSTEVTILTRRARLSLSNDVTERLRADRHRATEIAVTRVLIDAKSFVEAAPQAIAAICQAEEWALGEVWLYDPAASVLRLDGMWHAPGLRDVHGLELATTGVTIRPGVGLVGRVWQRDAPVWIRDLREEAEHGWSEYSERLGLRSAVGFPIRARSGVEAVGILFSHTIREPDEPLLDLLADIGGRIGQIFERDKVEASRRASVEAFQKAFHASPVPMAISSLHDGRFVEANLQFLRMFEYDRDEVVGRSSLELEMWVDQQQRRVLGERLKERGSIRDAEVQIRTKTGQLRRALMSIEYLDLRDQPTIITTLVDITEFVGAREAQSRLAAIVQSSEDAVFAKNLTGEIMTWNAGAEHMYGYTAAEAIGKQVEMLVPEDRLKEFERVMARLRNGEKLEPLETVRLRKDGHKIVVSVSVSPLRDAAGRLIGGSTIARDITEKKRSEQLVRRSEARFRQLFEVGADAMYLIDRRGTILEVNPAGAALVGVKDPAALRGINLGELLPPRELESARQYLRDLLHDRPIVEPFEIHLEPAGADRRFLHVRSRVIREEGTDPYVQVIARDVTPEKENQRRLLESERRASMGQVAAFVAHEINTPLTNISLLSANIARGMTDSAVLEKLTKIDAQRRTAANIVSELLSLTRSQEVTRIPVDLRGVVEAAIEQSVAFRKPDVRLVKELPRGPLIVSVDPLRMQQALVNLLKNAFQATGSGSVTVRLRSENNHITIAVLDTGSGIDAEMRARLFQPFVTTKPRSEGLGLGLVFTKQVVEGHEGSIQVTSEPGRGSTFTIMLARASDAGSTKETKASTTGRSPKAP